MDVKPARILILHDSPDNSPDNTKDESHNRSLTLHEAKMASTPLEGSKVKRLPHAILDESPISVKFDIDDSPSGSQEILDKLAVSESSLSIDG